MGKGCRMAGGCAVVTSDNPRSEDPHAIIEQILSWHGQGHTLNKTGQLPSTGRFRAPAMAISC